MRAFLIALLALPLAGCFLSGPPVCERAQAAAALICTAEPVIPIIIGDETGDFVGTSDPAKADCVTVSEGDKRPVTYCK